MASFSAQPHARKSQRTPWQPRALRPLNFIAATLICWTLIIVLEMLHTKSDRERGIFFAKDINELSNGTKFLYYYLPTVIAVMFSIYWSWIDGDAKRSQPYYELSKRNGALGKNSLFLTYPTMFALWIPFRALKKKHWMVFWSSTAALLTIVGLVPMLSAVFSTQMTSRIMAQEFRISKGFEASTILPAPSFLFSLFAIVGHNESFPPFMTKDYAIRPFSGPENTRNAFTTAWTVPTTVYGLDMKCQKGTPALFSTYNTTTCQHSNSLLEYESAAAFRNLSMDLLTSWHEDGACPDQHVLFVRVVQNATGSQPIRGITLYCEIAYFEQSAEITVESASRSPTQIDKLGPKTDLPHTLAQFLNSLENGFKLMDHPSIAEGYLPTNVPPSLGNHSLDISEDITQGSYITLLAVVLGGGQVADYLDPDLLEASLLKACRLTFVRAMTELLARDLSLQKQVQGKVVVASEAIVLNSFFTHSAELFLGLVSATAMALLFLSYKRRWNILRNNLSADPGSLAALMSLVVGDIALLVTSGSLAQASTQEVELELASKEFRLSDPYENDTDITIMSLATGIKLEKTTSGHYPKSTGAELSLKTHSRPSEYHIISAYLLIGFFTAILVVLGTFYNEAIPNGLPMPFRSQLGQNFVTNYLPTAVAMLIEPLWVMYTRLLCLFLPFQEFLTMKAQSARSIDLNYSSVPPQLTFAKAIRARHFLLASTCAMALLSNILATAFAGLIYKDIQVLETDVDLQMWKKVAFQHVSWLDVLSPDHFVVVESQYKHGTSPSPWTDSRHMFLPFEAFTNSLRDVPSTFIGRTKAISSDANCKIVQVGSEIKLTVSRHGLSFRMDLQDASNGTAACIAEAYVEGPWDMSDPDTERLGAPEACDMADWGFEMSIEVRDLDTDTWGNSLFSDGPTICHSALMLGYIRAADNRSILCQDYGWYHFLTGELITEIESDDPREVIITSEHEIAKDLSVIRCQPKLVIQEATIEVDSKGYVQEGSVDIHNDFRLRDDMEEFSRSFVAQGIMEKYLVQYQQGRGNSAQWHNDTSASHLLNYFLLFEMNSTRLIDPSQSLPPLLDVLASLEIVHARLFTTWLSLQRGLLFAPNSTILSPGKMRYKEERINFSRALFIVSEIILGVYIITAIAMFIYRPTDALPRLPNSIGAILPYLAGSTALEDFKGTSRMSTDGRIAHMKEKGPFMYGYGLYNGARGTLQVGVERAPFVTPILCKKEEKGRAWWKVWLKDPWAIKYTKIERTQEA